jgi:hypothetical protein
VKSRTHRRSGTSSIDCRRTFNVSREINFAFGCGILFIFDAVQAAPRERLVGADRRSLSCAFARRDGELVVWFWIGTHEEYNRSSIDCADDPQRAESAT